MRLALPFIILLGIANYNLVFGRTELHWKIQDELKELNITCSPSDTCKEARTADNLVRFSCQCSRLCVQLGTCCIDSTYIGVKPPKVRPTCRTMGNQKSYFMIDRCPESDQKDSVWESLCREDWKGEDDVMKLVPVTSLFTHITYKNYYCFRCHETTEDFAYWNVELGSSDYEFDETIDKSKVYVHFDYHYGSWIAPLGRGGALVPVTLSVNLPHEIWELPIICHPDMISSCSETWEDKDVRDKCEAYMGAIFIERNWTSIQYRNAHCAMCNDEDLANMTCSGGSSFAFGAKVPFSFTHLLDINRSDGDKVGRIQKCKGNFLWDPYAKTCRKLTCALPGYVIRDGKCTPP